MEEKKIIPWRKIVLTTAVICGVALLAYLGLQIAYALDFDSTRRTVYLQIAEQIKTVFVAIIDFFKPFVQIAVLLAIVDWVIRRYQIKLTDLQWQKVSVEKLVVVLIIGGFILVALKSGMEALTYLKDLALVTLGFYFGVSRKPKAEQG